MRNRHRLGHHRTFLAGSCFGALLFAVALTGCSTANRQAETGAAQNSEEVKQEAEQITEDSTLLMDAANIGVRKFLIGENQDSALPAYTPSVEDYQTAADLSNVENADRVHLQKQMLEKLAKNNFVVVEAGGYEFFDVYEMNRYLQFPSFVTTDSMMHTYHLYFAMLQKNTERDYLVQTVRKLSSSMQEGSLSQYEELKGTEWEEAAKINAAFFTVGASLLGEQPETPEEVQSIADQELKLILAAEKIAKSPLNGEDEDYSQYKPRGYYEGNEELEQYFRAMMWYGRRNFAQKDETMDRCALLMTIAMDQEAFQNWEQVYTITSFFAGASDDAGIYEYLPLIRQAYGDKVTTASLPGNQEAFETYHKLTGELEPPKINSVVFQDDEGKTDKTAEAKGYRFMGQRFSLDAAIFTQLCYSKVKADADGRKRMLPDALDVPAALGSETALGLLEENGNFRYQGYLDNMNYVRKEISDAPDTLWRASLYGKWLDTLRPLLEEKGKGYPAFMQNTEWTKKNLEGFLSSYTELKHDTVLYSKQFMAEMGGGDEVYDDRGYVEPEAELYARLSALTKSTSEGLEGFGVLSDTDRENLSRLSELADRLKEISIKELTGEELTEEDYELIRSYGGNLEHFWAESIKDISENENNESSEFPAALVVDIATNPNGSVLEQAIGEISHIYVVVPVDGKLRIAEGAVFSYYQFIQPIEDRMTDSEWRIKLGIELTEDLEYKPDKNIKQPEWTQSYRSSWVYDE